MLRFLKTIYLKWILKDCCHFCKFCRHKNVCPIGSNTLSDDDLMYHIEQQKHNKRTR